MLALFWASQINQSIQLITITSNINTLTRTRLLGTSAAPLVSQVTFIVQNGGCVVILLALFCAKIPGVALAKVSVPTEKATLAALEHR